MDGLLLIDKPKGWTSFDVVAKVRGLVKHETGVKRSKVGHTGTLDPLATGLMVVVVGKYCKRAGEFSKLDKSYDVTMKLGQTSTTGDAEGELTTISTQQPDQESVQGSLEQFVGTISQVPPAFSAIKVDGKRAYDLARAGQEVKLEPRQITVSKLKLTDYNYPFISFTAHVSSGTYIRSLVEDIGKVLETGAYMSDLRRTVVGQFELANALTIDEALDGPVEPKLLKVAE